MIGPLTPTQAAAEQYSDAFGWPVGCTSRAVWIRIPARLVALAIPEPLASGLQLSSPAIHYPGRPSYAVHLVGAPKPADRDGMPLLNVRGVVQLGYQCLLDLPPTRIVEGPLTWRSEPTPGDDLPTFASILRKL
jgi:hypothetical protein